MRKIYNLLFITSIICTLGWFGAHQVIAQATCTIEGAYFSQIADTEGIPLSIDFNAEEGGFTRLHVKSQNCNEGLKIFIKSIKLTKTSDDGTPEGLNDIISLSKTKIVNIDDERDVFEGGNGSQDSDTPSKALFTIPKQDGTLEVDYEVDGSGCYDANPEFDCYFYAQIVYKNISVYNGSDYFSTPRTRQEIQQKKIADTLSNTLPILFANCDGDCNGYDWDLEKVTARANTTCKINNVSFTKLEGGVSRVGTSIGNKKTQLTINSEECYSGFEVLIYYYIDNDGGSSIFDVVNQFQHNISKYPKNYYFLPPQNGELILIFKTTEASCFEMGGSDLSLTSNADCRLAVRIMNQAETISYYDSRKWLNDGYTIGPGEDVENFTDGVIFAECNLEDGEEDTSTDCDTFNDAWKLLSSNALNRRTGPELIPNDVKYDSNNPCYRPAETIDGINLPERYDPDCYEFLAPFPGIELNANGKPDNSQFIITIDPRTGEKRIAIKKLSQYQLGTFINKLFQIAIAILGVLSVIMIVIAGVEYMTTEAIYPKGEAKKKIIGAIGGLILSLGIFTLLHTINPQLLEINFGKNFLELEIDGGGLGINMNKAGPRGSGGKRSLDETWAQSNAPIINLTTANGSIITIKACDTDQFERYNAFYTTVQTRKELKPTVQRISDKWKAMGDTRYIIKSISGYNCRTIKAGGTDISTHSYGLTLDINPDENPYGKTLITDMPAGFVKLFTDEGFGWGGNWSSVKDAMHFSKTKNEQGDEKVD